MRLPINGAKDAGAKEVMPGAKDSCNANIAAPPRSILSLIGNTPLIELPNLSPKAGVRLYVKLEGSNPTGSLKDRIALAMILEAEAKVWW